MNRPRIYIAGPISKGNLAENVNRATAAFLTLAKAGLAPFCPHWSVYSSPCDELFRGPGEPVAGKVLCVGTVAGNPEMTHDDWLGVDLAWVRAADALLRLPGESKGADREVWEATLNAIPVFKSVEQVIDWHAHGMLPVP